MPTAFLSLALLTTLFVQKVPYDVFPNAAPPCYCVRYEALEQQRELIHPFNYNNWIPKGLNSLRGVVVHQHWTGEGAYRPVLVDACDLHCQIWCDPRNGSDATFQ